MRRLHSVKCCRRGWSDLMSWLDSIERLAERVVEGPSRALFRPRLEPVQVAKAAARALGESESIGPNGPQVANAYRIRLSPRDFARFGGFQRTLAEQVLGYLDEHARDRGLRPAAAWRVQLLSDPRIRIGNV